MQSLLKMQTLKNVLSQSIKLNTNIIRHGSYRNPKLVSEDTNEYTDYEVSKNPEEWKYVEALIPILITPEPKKDLNLPSGYKPATVQPGKYPYHIKRNRNHMLPVYLKTTRRNAHRRVFIANISGDIITLENSIQGYLRKLYPDEPVFPSRINELYSQLIFRGDYYNAICKFFYDRGF